MTRLMNVRRGRRGPTALALMLLAMLGSGAHRADAGYTYVDLGNLGTNAPSIGQGPGGGDINASGEVTGYYSGGGVFQAFLANNGAMTGIGTLGGTGLSFGFGINDGGQIVGSSNGNAFLYNSGTHTWTNLTIAENTQNGFSLAQANGINDNGFIVGLAKDANFNQHAFLYNSNGGTHSWTDLSTLTGGGAGQASAVNASGEVTGNMTLNGASHAFLYNGTTIKDLGALGGSASQGIDINASGQVAGWYQTGGVTHAFYYNGTTMIDPTAGTPYASFISEAYGINASGVVVGQLINGPTDMAFLYSNGILTNLSDVLSGWTLTGAFGINDSGQIAAVGTYNGVTSGDLTNGQSYGLLLTPAVMVPEPPAIALLCSGAAAGLGLRLIARRRIKAGDLIASDPADGSEG